VSRSGLPIKSGNTDSIYVTFNQPAPAAGWTLVVTTSDPAVQAPSTVFVPAGSTNVRVHVTGGTLTSAKSVTVNVQLGSQTKSSTLKVFPLTYSAFPAPSLQSPGNGSNFNYHIMISSSGARTSTRTTANCNSVSARRSAPPNTCSSSTAPTGPAIISTAPAFGIGACVTSTPAAIRDLGLPPATSK
jgi:hypothetical protein